METKTKKNKNWEKRARLGTKKWGILKYLSAEISTENQSRTAYECNLNGTC